MCVVGATAGLAGARGPDGHSIQITDMPVCVLGAMGVIFVAFLAPAGFLFHEKHAPGLI